MLIKFEKKWFLWGTDPLKTRAIKVFPGALLFLLFFAFLARAEEWFPPDYTPRFQDQINKTVAGLQKAASRRSMRLKYLNDSLDRTAEAAERLAKGENSAAFPLLKSARQSYSENSIALFLEGVALDGRFDSASANQRFKEFLTKGRTYTDFEKAVLSKNDYQNLRKEVENLLAGRPHVLALAGRGSPGPRPVGNQGRPAPRPGAATAGSDHQASQGQLPGPLRILATRRGRRRLAPRSDRIALPEKLVPSRRPAGAMRRPQSLAAGQPRPLG